ncbi:WecB/TagA/CpsF family glycosyltransferase [Vibrio sp. 1CM23M]|uniref:WecB/TagA/CpsF family glycosyltransferase n=1 Tax=Vibrio sp. 1CM23M TaxID=2929164 RepID=UPI0020BD7778|nr:WecB/TagA/CpsF family glycosyltransferase [Vibrio sp. 1CM23M]MCK8071264.1 WecB/TagA/CpsF family glycosyltransferase [Vibrio sp. 1CM23M]
MKRIKFLGCPIDSATMVESVGAIKSRILNELFTQHVVVNVAKIVNMKNDFELSKSVTDCDIINIDGMGVVWGARMLGHEVPERVAGVDLFHQLNGMAEAEGFPVFFLGATEDVVHRTAEVMQGNHPNLNIAGYHHGYFWDDEETLVKRVKDSGAKLLFVAITSPKKENFINKWRDELGVDFVMGVGGTFDVVAGKVNRAPKWMQDNGLEWFYRIVQEPRRMWKRYAITNSKFAWLLCKAKWEQKVRRKKST